MTKLLLASILLCCGILKIQSADVSYEEEAREVAKLITHNRPDLQDKVYETLLNAKNMGHIPVAYDPKTRETGIDYGFSSPPELLILEAIAKRAQDRERRFHMLDVGAAYGFYSAFATMTDRVSATMVELSKGQINPLKESFKWAVSCVDPNLLKASNGENRYAINNMDIRKREKFPAWWTEDGGAFQIVTAGMLMHFFNGPETLQFLRDMNDVLKDGGMLCISTVRSYSAELRRPIDERFDTIFEKHRKVFEKRANEGDLFPGMLMIKYTDSMCTSSGKISSETDFLPLPPNARVGIDKDFSKICEETLTSSAMSAISRHMHDARSIKKLLSLCGFEVVQWHTEKGTTYGDPLVVIAKKVAPVDHSAIQVLIDQYSQEPVIDGTEGFAAEGWKSDEEEFDLQLKAMGNG